MENGNTLSLLGINPALFKGAARINYMRQRWAARFGGEASSPVVEKEVDGETGEVVAENAEIGARVLVATETEVKEEAKQIVSVAKDDCEIVEDERKPTEMGLIRPEVATVAATKETEILLSRAEKRALAKEVAELRKKEAHAAYLARLPFAIVPVGFWAV